MPRVVSFIVLLAVVLLAAAMFFRVMVGFLVPLFLAGVLVVVFQPVHMWIVRRIPKRPRIAALVTTLVVMLVVFVPTVILGWQASLEGQHVYQFMQSEEGAKLAGQLNEHTSKWMNWYEDIVGQPLQIEALMKSGTNWLSSVLLSSVMTTLSVLVGLAIMLLSLYYFLADGPGMIDAMTRLSPMDDKQEMELLDRFGEISRAVVIATLLAAVLQGIFAGIGYYFALPAGSPIFLLTAATMVLAIVPFIGATGIWLPTCIYLVLFGPQTVDGVEVHNGNWVTAVVLGVYCLVVVSSIDNIVKPLVLHGQSNLHPLLALLSVIGGVQALGAIGILVGPMLVSFLQALLNMLRKELESMDSGDIKEAGRMLAAGAGEDLASAE